VKEEIAIVGGGLVGSILSMYLAKAGYKVVVFERGPDRRETQMASDRSINLTICDRGFHSLERIGVDEIVRACGVPAPGRVIHNVDGTVSYQPYGNNQEAIYSISRNELNRILLRCAGDRENIDLRFHEECIGLDVASSVLRFKNRQSGQESTYPAGIVFGADGAYSAVRSFVQRRPRFDYSQVYSTQAYKEMSMPPAANGDWPLQPNALHIWPRGQHMLIAFANTGHSFTVALHMPYEGKISFASVRSGEDVTQLFRDSFPDAIGLMPKLVEEYLGHPHNSMVTIRCNPWVFEDKVALIGDAAHAIYPSYGQGANAGSEDCRVLLESLERHGHHWGRALAEYQALRKPNADAIADLSDRHFVELRDLVGDRRFQLRKEVERRINKLYPERFRDLYSMVTFTTMPYVDALETDRQQSVVVDGILAADDFERRWRCGDIDGMIHDAMTSDSRESAMESVVVENL